MDIVTGRKKGPLIRKAPTVRIPEPLLRELDQEGARYFAGANLSRIQLVSLALREWLDTRKAQREAEERKK